MDQHQAGQSALRRVAGLGALAVVLSLSVIGLTRCRGIEEPLAGVDLTPTSTHSTSECVDRCNERFKEGVEEAVEQFRDAIKDCGHSQGCRKKAARAFQDKLEELRSDLKECKRHCYNEGGGDGGR